MIETVTAVMGLVSAGIFLAHAFEGYRYRAWALTGRRFGWPTRFSGWSWIRGSGRVIR